MTTVTSMVLAAVNGRRPSTAIVRETTALADRFTGLPDGITRWRLAAALRGAAQSLGLTEPMLRLLEHYIDLSWDQDWMPGSEPVIGQPLIEIAEYLGKSERQIRNIERALAARGLIAWRDSGNHHRKARRNRAGCLVYAYGPSLAPLGVRAAEIVARAAEMRQMRNDTRRLRIAISALRRRVTTELAEAAASGIDIDDIGRGFARLPTRLPPNSSQTALCEHRDALAELSDRLRAQLTTHTAADSASQISATAEICTPPYKQIQTEDAINGVLAITGQQPPTAPKDRRLSIIRDDARPRPGPLNRQTPPPTKTMETFKPTLQDIIAATGPIMASQILMEDRRDWSAVIEGARTTATSLGISQSLWARACTTLGRQQAAIATIVVEQGICREAGNRHRTVQDPAAYFAAMIDRGDRQTLRLDLSLRAILRRQGRTPPEVATPP